MTQNGGQSVESTQKLREDLDAVMERVVLCREIMLESPGIEQDETLAGVIGYLEACRDRMGDLVDAGAQGELPEDVFERCLTVNDAILRTLEAERTGTKIPVKDEGPEGAQKSPKPLIDMGPDNDEEEEDADRPVGKAGGVPVASSPSMSKPKAAVEDSLLAPYVPPAGAAGATATADPFANSGDPFAEYGSAAAVPPPAPPAPAASAPAPSGAAPAAATTTTNATAAATQPPAPPQLPDSAVADLENLLGQTTVSPPPAVAASAGSSAGAQAADDFDAFLDSLDSKPVK